MSGFFLLQNIFVSVTKTTIFVKQSKKMTQEKMIKRTFQLRANGEKNGLLYVEIRGKEDIYCAWLPKNKITISNRQYGFGGLRTADVVFPMSLLPLFKSIYPVKDIVENTDGTYSFTYEGHRFVGSCATLEAFKKNNFIN
jgi:hypothetical protein